MYKIEFMFKKGESVITKFGKVGYVTSRYFDPVTGENCYYVETGEKDSTKYYAEYMLEHNQDPV